MPFGLFKNTIVRACFACGVVQLTLLAQVEVAAQEREGGRRGAPITFATAAPPSATPAPDAPVATPGQGGAQGVTWRYPDEPDIIYSAAGIVSAPQTPPSVPPAVSTPAAPTVLDLRRPPSASTEVFQPEPIEERPQWLAEERVGPPYQEAGSWYVPTPEPGFAAEGALAVYAVAQPGAATASGEAYDPRALTAAHPTLPIPSLIQVTDLASGRDVIVRLNDRGPFNAQGLVALTPAAADALGAAAGARIHVRYLGPAPRRLAAGDTGRQPSATPAAAPRPASAPALRPDTALADLPLPPNVAQSRPASYSPAPAPSRGAYVVQLGAFANLENAHALRARVRTAGVVVIEPVQTAQGELFRVRLGPFATEHEAQEARAHAERLGVAGGAVRALR